MPQRRLREAHAWSMKKLDRRPAAESSRGLNCENFVYDWAIGIIHPRTDKQDPENQDEGHGISARIYRLKAELDAIGRTAEPFHLLPDGALRERDPDPPE